MRQVANSNTPHKLTTHLNLILLGLALGIPAAFLADFPGYLIIENWQLVVIFSIVLSIHLSLHQPISGSAWFGVGGLVIIVAIFTVGLAAAGITAVIGLTVSIIVNLWLRRFGLTVWLIQAALLGTICWVGVLTQPLLANISLFLRVGIITLSVVGVHGVGSLLRSAYQIKAIWQERASILIEAVIVLQIVPLILIAEQLPPVIFGMAMLGVLYISVVDLRITRRDHYIQQQSKDWEQLATLGYQLAEHLVLDELLAELAQHLQAIIPAQQIYIALFNPDTPQLLQVKLLWENAPIPSPDRVSIRPDSLEAVIIRERKAVMLAAGETGEASVVKRTPEVAFLGVPLSNREHVIGVMALLNNQQQAYSPRDLNLLQNIASQAGMAIENANLYTSRTRLIKNLSSINESVQTLLYNLDSSSAVQTICQTAMEITAADRAAVFLLNRETNQLEIVNAINLPSAPNLPLQTILFDLQRRKAQIIRDIEVEGSANLRRLSQQIGFRAMAETYMTSGSAVTGMLVVYHKNIYDYPKTDLDLLQVLANQITVALENSELLRALELYASEMAQLVHLSRTTLTSLLPEEVAERSIDTLRQMFNSNSVMIVTIEQIPDGNEIVEVLAHTPTSYKTPHRQSLNLYPELQVIRDGVGPMRQVIHSDDPKISRGMLQLLTRNQEQTMIAVPLTIQNNTFGVVMIGNQGYRQFSEREWQFVEMATNLTATQIKNAQLYNATREALVRRLEQLAFIETLVKQMSSSLDIEHIIGSIFEATVRITRADRVLLALKHGQNQYRLIHQHNSGEQVGRYTEKTDHLTGAVKEVFENREVILSPAYALPDDMYQTPLMGTYPSVLAVPLLAGDEMQGVLSVERDLRNFFTEEQAAFLQNLAGHMVISLTNARLMEQREHQVDTLSQLRRLSLSVAGLDNQAIIARQIMETAASILDGQQVGLYLYDDQQDQFKYLTDPTPPTEDGTTPPPLEAEIAHDILRSKQVRVFMEQDGETVKQSQLVIPMSRGADIQALLVITFTGYYNPDQKDQETIELLANQVIGHLETARLYEKIRSGNSRMRTILESAQDGILLLDHNQRLIDYNSAAAHFIGLDLAAYLMQPFEFPDYYRPIHEDDNTVKLMSRGDSKSDTNRIQVEIIYPDGRLLNIEQRNLPVHDSQNQIVGSLIVLRDITEEQELQRYRDEIIFMLVHDLRAPLGSVISGLNYAEILAETDATPDSPIIEVLQLATRSSNRLLNLINTLLDVEREQMAIIRTPWDVEELVISASADLTQAAQEVNIFIEKTIQPNLPPINIDGDKIQRVLINLIDNALDYSQQKIRVDVRLAEDEAHIIFRVNDDGPGIAPENRAAIFGKFKQGAGQENRRKSHTGIGLTYCLRAVQAHDGEIWVADDDDAICQLEGACFVFQLPLKSSIGSLDNAHLQEQER